MIHASESNNSEMIPLETKCANMFGDPELKVKFLSVSLCHH